eukprot:jgi/Mesvir1/24255/Mv10957-RA.1
MVEFHQLVRRTAVFLIFCHFTIVGIGIAASIVSSIHGCPRLFSAGAGAMAAMSFVRLVWMVISAFAQASAANATLAELDNEICHQRYRRLRHVTWAGFCVGVLELAVLVLYMVAFFHASHGGDPGLTSRGCRLVHRTDPVTKSRAMPEYARHRDEPYQLAASSPRVEALLAGTPVEAASPPLEVGASFVRAPPLWVDAGLPSVGASVVEGSVVKASPPSVDASLGIASPPLVEASSAKASVVTGPPPFADASLLEASPQLLDASAVKASPPSVKASLSGVSSPDDGSGEVTNSFTQQYLRELSILLMVLLWFGGAVRLFLGSKVLRWRAMYRADERWWELHYRHLLWLNLAEALTLLGRSELLKSKRKELQGFSWMVAALLNYRGQGTTHSDVLSGLSRLAAITLKEDPTPCQPVPYELLKEASELCPMATAAYTGPVLDMGRWLVCFPCSWALRQQMCIPCFYSKRPAVVEGDNWWRGHAAAFIRYAGIPPNALIRGSVAQPHGEAVYFVVVQHALRRVVVAIRGTESVEDVVSDAFAGAVTFTQEDVPWKLTGAGEDPGSHSAAEIGYAHEGVLMLARELAVRLNGEAARSDDVFPNEVGSQCQTGGFLSRLMGAGGPCQGYNLVLVGHSLGSGVASCLALRLKRDFPNVRSFGYNAMPSVDAGTAARCKKFVTNIVYNSDVVSRACLGTLERMREAAVATAIHAELEAAKRRRRLLANASRRFANMLTPRLMRSAKDGAPRDPATTPVTSPSTPSIATGRGPHPSKPTYLGGGREEGGDGNGNGSENMIGPGLVRRVSKDVGTALTICLGLISCVRRVRYQWEGVGAKRRKRFARAAAEAAATSAGSSAGLKGSTSTGGDDSSSKRGTPARATMREVSILEVEDEGEGAYERVGSRQDGANASTESRKSTGGRGGSGRGVKLAKPSGDDNALHDGSSLGSERDAAGTVTGGGRESPFQAPPPSQRMDLDGGGGMRESGGMSESSQEEGFASVSRRRLKAHVILSDVISPRATGAHDILSDASGCDASGNGDEDGSELDIMAGPRDGSETMPSQEQTMDVLLRDDLPVKESGEGSSNDGPHSANHPPEDTHSGSDLDVSRSEEGDVREQGVDIKQGNGGVGPSARRAQAHSRQVSFFMGDDKDKEGSGATPWLPKEEERADDGSTTTAWPLVAGGAQHGNNNQEGSGGAPHYSSSSEMGSLLSDSGMCSHMESERLMGSQGQSRSQGTGEGQDGSITSARARSPAGSQQCTGSLGLGSHTYSSVGGGMATGSLGLGSQALFSAGGEAGVTSSTSVTSVDGSWVSGATVSSKTNSRLYQPMLSKLQSFVVHDGSGRAWADQGDLVIPGQVVYVARRGAEVGRPVRLAGDGKRRREVPWEHSAELTSPHDVRLRDIVVNERMFLDHLPWRLERALHDLVSQMGQV